MRIHQGFLQSEVGKSGLLIIEGAVTCSKWSGYTANNTTFGDCYSTYT